MIICSLANIMSNPDSHHSVQTSLSPGKVGNVYIWHAFSPEMRMLEVFVAALTIFVLIYAIRRRKCGALPTWPIVGMLPSFVIAFRTDALEWLIDMLHKENLTFAFDGAWFSDLNCVVTVDPRNLEYVLKTKFSNFPKGEFFHNKVQDLLGDGIFSADNETWRRQRKAASIEFHSSAFQKMAYESLFELVHSRLLHVLEDSIKECNSIDLQDVFLRLTFDNICMIAFGVDPGCLRPGLPEIPFAKAFEEATELTMFRFIVPSFLWKAMRYLNMGRERNLKKSIDEVDKFAQEVIHTRKTELSLACHDNNIHSKSDLLTVFMRLKDDEGKPFSDRFLRDICVNFILAGSDTSSVALSWFFWLLDKNPDVEKRILEEIYGIIAAREKSQRENENDNNLAWKPEEVKKMDYLQAALSESLRLYPSVPLDHKEVIVDEVFPDGTILKKGTKVIYAIYAMGRMESIWGKDCREYKPERWLREGKFTSESAYKFTAFNGGPRLCLGKDFAYYQMKYVAASIIYRYRVEVVDNHVVVPKMALIMYMKHGLKVKLRRRRDLELHNHENAQH